MKKGDTTSPFSRQLIASASDFHRYILLNFVLIGNCFTIICFVGSIHYLGLIFH